MGVKEQYRDYVMTGFVKRVEPVVAERGDGAFLYDADGTPHEVLTPDLLRTVYGIDARVESGGEWPTVTTFGRARP